jgi:hypothetical protein
VTALVDADAVADALRETGAASADAVIGDLAARPIGIGALADTVLLEPVWRHGTGPATLVAKLPSADPTAAATAASIGAYEREVRFYEDLAMRTTVSVPRWLGTIGGNGLLLEDLSALTPGDQFTSPTLPVLRAAREQLALLQAPFWDDPVVGAEPWLHRRQGVPIPGIAARMAASWGAAAGRIAGGFDPSLRAVIDRFVPAADSWAQSLDGPFTLSHHDFRMDNLLLGPADDDGPGRLVVLDWQTVGWGAPMFDLAYLLGTSLEPATRRAVERSEVAAHVAALASLGVTWSFADAWEAYRRASFAVLLMLVPPTGSVKGSERSDRMYRRLLQQGAQMVLDLDAEEFLVA